MLQQFETEVFTEESTDFPHFRSKKNSSLIPTSSANILLGKVKVGWQPQKPKLSLPPLEMHPNSRSGLNIASI